MKGKIAWRLLRKKLGFRMLMVLIPLDASLVGGSHGCRPADPQDAPILIAPRSADIPDSLGAAGVRDALIRICGGG